MTAKLSPNTREDIYRDIRSAPPVNMTIDEFAVYVGVSFRKARDYIHQGLLPHARLAGKIIVTRKAADDFVASLVR